MNKSGLELGIIMGQAPELEHYLDMAVSLQLDTTLANLTPEKIADDLRWSLHFAKHDWGRRAAEATPELVREKCEKLALHYLDLAQHGQAERLRLRAKAIKAFGESEVAAHFRESKGKGLGLHALQDKVERTRRAEREAKAKLGMR